MTANNNLILTVYDSEGAPKPGVTPTWEFCLNLDTGLPVSPQPTVTDRGHGVYEIERLDVGHVIGQLNFGATSYPQYFTYDVNPYSTTAPYVTFDSAGESDRPVITSVQAPKRTQVIVTFSEPVKMTTDMAGALRLANYEIPGLTISAIRSLSEEQVLLTTSTQALATKYALTVYNVQDLYGNSISPA